MTSPTKTSALDPHAYRGDFPILSTMLHEGVPLVYLDNGATTQRPKPVIDTIVETYERYYSNVHRGIHWLSDQSTDLYESAREKVRQFIGSPSLEQVIFTSGATAGINLIARSWGDACVSAGDEIIVTEMEHHSNLVPWHQLAERTGAVIRYIPITDDGRLDLDAFDSILTERTKMVAVAGVSNVLGTINPVEEIIAKTHDAGALVTIDGAQSVPHLPVDVAALDVDFLVFSGHKMLAPTGIGVVYGKRCLLEQMPPFLGGGSMIRRVKVDSFEPADLPAKFEAGTPAIVPAIGLGAAIDYINAIGLPAIHEHELLLTRRAHEVLQSIDGLNILGPSPDQKAGIVSFAFKGNRPHAHDIAQLLDRRGIAVRAGHHCAMPLHKRLGLNATTRASFYLYNTLEEIDLLGEALEGVKQMFQRKR